MQTPSYLNLRVTAPARLAALRAMAAAGSKKTWREARAWRLNNWETAYIVLSQGYDNQGRHRRPIWSSHAGDILRGLQFCDEVVSSIGHNGWYTNEDCSEMVRGITYRLSHGRFVAGYVLSMNDEQVIFDEVFTDGEDAARMADEHARVIGELEQEHDREFRAAQELESKEEDALKRLRECLALRNRECFAELRAEALDTIAELRRIREKLSTEFAGVL